MITTYEVTIENNLIEGLSESEFVLLTSIGTRRKSSIEVLNIIDYNNHDFKQFGRCHLLSRNDTMILKIYVVDIGCQNKLVNKKRAHLII